MAKKTSDGENKRKSKKRPVTLGAQRVVKPTQPKSTASRKPAAAPKQTTSPPTQNMVSDKPQTTFLSLVGANLTATVLENLKTSSATVKAALSDTLNSELKSQLSATLTSAKLTVLSGLVDKMPAVDIATSSNLSIQAFLKQQLDPMVSNKPAMQKAVDGEIAKLSDTTTIGELLQLGTSLQNHLLFQADAMKAMSCTCGNNTDYQLTNQR